MYVREGDMKSPNSSLPFSSADQTNPLLTSHPVFYALTNLILIDQVRSLPKSLNNKLLTRSPAVNILDIIGRSLEVTGGIVALGNEDVILLTAGFRCVERNWWTLR